MDELRPRVLMALVPQEGRDGYDAVEFLATQAWCNGNIGFAGNSYLAAVQWYSNINATVLSNANLRVQVHCGRETSTPQGHRTVGGTR